MALVLLFSALGIFCLVMEFILVIGGFVLGWMASDFLIPLRDNYTKSGATIFGIKIGIAIGGAYAAFVFGNLALAKGIEVVSANMDVVIAIGVVIALIVFFLKTKKRRSKKD